MAATITSPGQVVAEITQAPGGLPIMKDGKLIAAIDASKNTFRVAVRPRASRGD